MTTLKIFNPIESKGLNKKCIVKRDKGPHLCGEENYIDLGLIVYNDQGQAVNDVEVIITATEPEQNKTLTSTGNVIGLIDDKKGVRVVPARKGGRITPYYPFHYEFNTVGNHEITFSVGAIQEKVKIKVDAE